MPMLLLQFASEVAVGGCELIVRVFVDPFDHAPLSGKGGIADWVAGPALR